MSARILDMVERKLLPLTRIEYLVLDEADQMFDAGFAPAIERIIGLTYSPQIVLASATMPGWVSAMIAKHLNDPLTIRVVAEGPSLLEHGLVRTDAGLKLRLLSDILRQHRGTIVFGRTKHGVRKLNRDLQRLGHRSVELQGNMAQNAREHVMATFRAERADVLVATNVAARGLDLTHVGLVVNYDLPDSAEAMTHRVGRTARNGSAGRAVTLLTQDDHEKWAKLRREGAPALRTLDSAELSRRGGWLYVEDGAPVATRAPSQVRSTGGRRRSSRGRGRRPVYRQGVEAGKVAERSSPASFATIEVGLTGPSFAAVRRREGEDLRADAASLRAASRRLCARARELLEWSAQLREVSQLLMAQGDEIDGIAQIVRRSRTTGEELAREVRSEEAKAGRKQGR